MKSTTLRGLGSRTFARQTLSFHKITNATPIGRKPTATFVRKMGATENGHAAVFEVQFGKKTDRATEASSERSAEQLFHGSVCCVSCAADLGTSEDCFEPTASCINGTKKRQLVTRSGLSRLRCCVCHLHHRILRNSASTGVSLHG